MLTDKALRPPASATMFLRVALGWLHPDDEYGESGTEASETKTSLCNALDTREWTPRKSFSTT
ncbi:MAG: hypothetical protein WKF77_31310 [Planctomycetaceae bacterium]